MSPTIPFGYSNSSNVLVEATEVPRGGDCNCKCPSCGMELVARKGEVYIDYFAHYRKADEASCQYSHWVVARDMAKQLIRDIKYLSLKKSMIGPLQILPYCKTFSSLIILDIEEPQHGDFILHTSLGEILVYILTPEHHTPLIDNNSVLMKSLVLTIDLNTPTTNNFISKKKALLDLIVNNVNSKKFILPSRTFIEEIEQYDPFEMPDTEEEKERREREDAEIYLDYLIANLHFHRTGLSKESIEDIDSMKSFYNFCFSRLRRLSSGPYAVLNEQDNLQYIGYKNYNFCYIKIEHFHIIYLFKSNELVIICRTPHADEILPTLDKHIDEQEEIEHIYNNSITPIYKKKYVEDEKLLVKLGLKDEKLSTSDIRAVNMMISFNKRVLQRDRANELTDAYKILEEARNLWLVSYKCDFYCIVLIRQSYYIYQVFEHRKVILIGKGDTLNTIHGEIDQYLKELDSLF